jgi:hypothetical protein
MERYTEDKRDITGIAGEAWHFRYVGAPHAWYCYDNGLCYEEYVLFLKECGGYTAEYGGEKYSVLYQLPQEGNILIPDGLEYEVSGDNTGGYVLTAR